jgi:hypothetical protein
MQMTARLGGTPLYCGACASTLVQIKRSDMGGVATAECRNPKCEMVGKLFLGADDSARGSHTGNGGCAWLSWPNLFATWLSMPSCRTCACAVAASSKIKLFAYGCFKELPAAPEIKHVARTARRLR